MMRLMKDGDLAQIMKIEKKIFSSPWSLRNYLEELHLNPYAELFVEEDATGITGYCDLWITFEQAQIATIGVRPDCRRRGIAQAMMDWMIREAESRGCETMSLEARVSNQAARSLYEKNGFVQAGLRRQYYSDNGEDAVLMIRPLGGTGNDNASGY